MNRGVPICLGRRATPSVLLVDGTWSLQQGDQNMTNQTGNPNTSYTDPVKVRQQGTERSDLNKTLWQDQTQRQGEGGIRGR